MVGKLSPNAQTALRATCVLLGTHARTQRHRFALAVPHGDEGAEVRAQATSHGWAPQPGAANKGAGDGAAAPRFHHLRALVMSAAAGVPAAEAAVLGRACSLLHFHRVTRFCSACGRATLVPPAGGKRVCCGCGAELFPRVDPIAIAAVTVGSGDHLHVLLGRQRHFPRGMYSALAGFVEVRMGACTVAPSRVVTLGGRWAR